MMSSYSRCFVRKRRSIWCVCVFLLLVLNCLFATNLLLPLTPQIYFGEVDKEDRPENKDDVTFVTLLAGNTFFITNTAVERSIWNTKKGPLYEVWVYFVKDDTDCFIRGEVTAHGAKVGRGGGRWMVAEVKGEKKPLHLFPSDQIEPLDEDKYYAEVKRSTRQRLV